MKRWVFGLLGLIIIAGAIYIFGPLRAQRQAAADASLQTAPAERGSLTATVGATGVVRANQSAVLTWQTSGTLQEVLVNVGDTTAAGDLLASLQQTSLPQSVILAQADLVSAQRAQDDLMNSQIQQASALQALEEARQALEDARNPELVAARALEAVANAQKAVENAERTLRWTQTPATQSYVDEAQAQVTLAKDVLDRAKEKYAPYENKPEDNVVRARLLSDMAAAQQQYDFAVRNLNSMLGTASPVDQAVAQANLETVRAQLADAQREFERVKDGPTQADISLLEARLADAQREWDRLKDGPATDDLAAAQARVAAARAAIDQAFVKAPFNGTVTEVNTKPGDQASPGVPAFRVDDLSRLLVDVQVSEVDINRIQVGQDVSLVFDAVLNKQYTGSVTEVALVGSTTQGVVDFTVTVELTNSDQSVKPGMTAAVNMVVSQLDDVLLVPNRAVRVQEGRRVVYVLRDGFPEAVEVVLGASSEVNSEVIGGDLKEGDPVILNPPTVFEQNGPPPFVNQR
jgi:HlyD family secretion protein